MSLPQGVARFYKAKKQHVITTQTVSMSVTHVTSLITMCGVLQEHKCVLDSCRALESEGMDVTYLPVGKSGILDLQVRSRPAPRFVGTLSAPHRTWRLP